MARGKGRPKNYDGVFVGVERNLLESKAFKALKFSTGKLYPYMLLQGQMNLRNGITDFAFTYADAKKRGFSEATFSRALTDLIDKGFLDPTGYGGLRGFCLIENHFSLSKRWKDYGTDRFVSVPRYDQEKMTVCGRV